MDKKRIINVDGVSYSLDTGKPLIADKIRQPAIPTPSHETEEKSAAEQHELRPAKTTTKRLTRFDGISARPKDDYPTTLKKVSEKPSHLHTVKPSQPEMDKAKKPSEGLVVSKKNTTRPHIKSPQKRNMGIDSSVSHPTLPMPTAEPMVRRNVTPAIHVFFHPFVQKVDRRIIAVSLGRVLWSWRYWFCVIAPFIIYFGWRLTIMTPNQILALLHRILIALPYQTMLAIGLLGCLLISFSYYIGSQAAQIISALKLKQIDHRLSSARFFFGQSDAKLFRTLFARISHLILFWGSLFAICGLMLYLYSLDQIYFETIKLPVLTIIGLLGLIWLLLVGMRWPISRCLLAATDQTTGSVEVKSFSLVFRNLFKALGIAIFWTLISLLFLGAVGAIIWSLSMYLINDLSIGFKILLSGIGVILMGFLFCVYTIWSMVFWASSYRVLIGLRPRPHLSEYLQIESPSRNGKMMLGLLCGLILVIIITLGVVGYLYQDTVVAAAKNLAHKLPESLNNLVPRLPK